MIAFFLLLFMLDIQHPPQPDNPFAGFVVTSAVDNSATSGCTMNPGSGNNFNADMISVDWAGVNDPHEGEAPVSHLPGAGLGDEALIAPMVMPYNPPGQPNPDPEPPAAATPEPSTMAILTITGAMLLFLLFGRKRQKLHRRTR